TKIVSSYVTIVYLETQWSCTLEQRNILLANQNRKVNVGLRPIRLVMMDDAGFARSDAALIWTVSHYSDTRQHNRHAQFGLLGGLKDTDHCASSSQNHIEFVLHHLSTSESGSVTLSHHSRNLMDSDMTRLYFSFLEVRSIEMLYKNKRCEAFTGYGQDKNLVMELQSTQNIFEEAQLAADKRKGFLPLFIGNDSFHLYALVLKVKAYIMQVPVGDRNGLRVVRPRVCIKYMEVVTVKGKVSTNATISVAPLAAEDIFHAASGKRRDLMVSFLPLTKLVVMMSAIVMNAYCYTVSM
ncbi:hypothetical protein C0J52_25575, partial [Blattella germanica]